jgi:hypothetical protein
MLTAVNTLVRRLGVAAVVAVFVGIPLAVGLTTAIRWPRFGPDAYPTIAQVIASLMIAIAVELFAREGPEWWEDPHDQVMIIALMGTTWAGLFGCIRAMLHEGTLLTETLAVAGLMAASLLLSLALYMHIRRSTRRVGGVVVLVFLVTPLFVLVAW